jgi:Zn-dependent peptidase ImmA (M78 family)
MRRQDDSALTRVQYARIRKEAERALREAGSLGVLPTPIDRIMAAARVQEVKEEILDSGFLSKLRSTVSNAGDVVKRAVSKVLGLFHASEGLVFLNQSLLGVKKRFVGFHEAGHGFLPWQRPMYALVEDCEKTLDPDTAELFDREANVFATEVLFQLDTFSEMSAGEPFSIWTPVNLAKRFKASNYAAIRQYVSKSKKACVVVVLNMPEFVRDDGFRVSLRRVIQSDSFTELFGTQVWKDVYTPDDEIGALVPLGPRRSTGKRSLALTDRNGDSHECIAESFSTGYQVFVLIHAARTLTAVRILIG